MAKPQSPKPEPVAPDSFSREVDEELRQEYLKQLWDRFGLYIILVAIVIVLLTGGYRGWTYYQNQLAIEAGDDFTQALELDGDEESAAALKAFQGIVDGNHQGYAVLAQFRVGTALVQKGDWQAAVAQFDQIAETVQDEHFQALARLRAGLLLVDQGQLQEVQNRLQALTDSDSPWRHSAREYIALAAYKAGDHEMATSMVNLILEDRETLPVIRTRTQVLKTQIEAAHNTATN